MTPAFLLTRQWVDDRDGLRLDFWLSTAEGPMSVSIHGQQALFFIRQIRLRAVQALLADQPRRQHQAAAVEAVSPVSRSARFTSTRNNSCTARAIASHSRASPVTSPISARPNAFCANDSSPRPSKSTPITAPSRCTMCACSRVTIAPTSKVMSFDIESDYESDALFSIAFRQFAACGEC